MKINNEKIQLKISPEHELILNFHGFFTKWNKLKKKVKKKSGRKNNIDSIGHILQPNKLCE